MIHTVTACIGWSLSWAEPTHGDEDAGDAGQASDHHRHEQDPPPAPLVHAVPPDKVWWHLHSRAEQWTCDSHVCVFSLQLPDEKPQMRRNIEICWVVGETVVDHGISKPVKSYQKEVSSPNWIMSYQCQNTEKNNNKIDRGNRLASSELFCLVCEVFSNSGSTLFLSSMNFSASSVFPTLPRRSGLLSLAVIFVWFAWGSAAITTSAADD